MAFTPGPENFVRLTPLLIFCNTLCIYYPNVGNICIERFGTMLLNNHLTGHRATLTFKKTGWFNSKNLHQFEGSIEDKFGKVVRNIYGNWTREMWSCSPEAYKAAFSVSRGELVEQPHDAKLIASVIPR